MIQRYLILIVCALAHLSAYAEGFLAGTLVKTPFGYENIENLTVGDKVVCYDFMGKCVTRTVTHVQQEEVDTYAQITIGNEQVFAALDHKFYVPNDNAWLETHKIKPGSVLLKRCTEYIPVDSVEVIEASAVVYDITVDQLHNFCVTTEDVCVHNVVPFVAGVTFTWAFGGGLVPAISGLFTLGAFAIKALFEGGMVAPRNMELDFDADTFGERFKSRPPYSEYEENIAYRDPWDKNKPKKNSGDKKGAGSNNSGSGTDDSNSSSNKNRNRNSRNDKQDHQKERKKNEMHESEFWKSVSNDYQKVNDNTYKLKRNGKAVEGAEYLQWDHTHQEVEAYGRNKRHLGALDPAEKVLYKAAEYGRRIDI